MSPFLLPRTSATAWEGLLLAAMYDTSLTDPGVGGGHAGLLSEYCAQSAWSRLVPAPKTKARSGGGCRLGLACASWKVR